MNKNNKFIFFKNEKRGFELALNTIVIIILAVLLLLFAVMFFTRSSGSFIDTIKGFFSYSNLDSIVQRCNLLVDSNSLNSFCCEKVEVKYYVDGKKETGVFSCVELLNREIDNRIKTMDCGELKC